EPFGHGNERPRVLVGRRRVHQNGASITFNHAEVAAEGRIAGQRQDLRAPPPARGKEFMSIGRGSHRGGHRFSHDGGTFAVKRRAPLSAKSRLSCSASGQALSPARSGHSTSSTASAAKSSPSSSSSDAFSIRYKSTCQTGGSSSS